MNVTVVGALSGVQFAMVNGALDQLGDTTRQWANCWSLGPSFTLQLGDSGSVVLGAGPGPSFDHVFGHFVGGSYWPGRPGLVHLYVQDLESCLQLGLNQHITI
jgi:hypothetical protein